jgi:hypothetical protein
VDVGDSFRLTEEIRREEEIPHEDNSPVGGEGIAGLGRVSPACGPAGANFGA